MTGQRNGPGNHSDRGSYPTNQPTTVVFISGNVSAPTEALIQGEIAIESYASYVASWPDIQPFDP